MYLEMRVYYDKECTNEVEGKVQKFPIANRAAFRGLYGPGLNAQSLLALKIKKKIKIVCRDSYIMYWLRDGEI